MAATKIQIEWVDIPGGTFLMGNPNDEADRWDNETQHQVKLNAFKMSKYEITFEQYDVFAKLQTVLNQMIWAGDGKKDLSSMYRGMMRSLLPIGSAKVIVYQRRQNGNMPVAPVPPRHIIPVIA